MKKLVLTTLLPCLSFANPAKASVTVIDGAVIYTVGDQGVRPRTKPTALICSDVIGIRPSRGRCVADRFFGNAIAGHPLNIKLTDRRKQSSVEVDGSAGMPSRPGKGSPAESKVYAPAI